MTRCLYCGAFLGVAGPPASAPLPGGAPAIPPAPASWPPPPPPGWTPPASPYGNVDWGEQMYRQDVWQSRDRTRTGLLLLAIGIGISWIPYIGGIGGFLALIGVLLVFLGRHGFGEPHRRTVVIGAVLLAIGFLATVVLAFAIVGAIFSATGPGSSPQNVLNATSSVLQNVALGGLVVAAISGIGQVIMVYELADPTSRWLLWLGLISGIAISLLIYWIELPQITSALAGAGNNSGADMALLNSLQAQLQVDSLARVLPAGLSAFAYYRIWQKVDAMVLAPA